MKLIAGFLIANGVALANAENPTESQVLDAIKTVLTSKAGEVTALGNEKSSLTGQITTLTADRDAHKKRADESATALANETTLRKAERKHAATAAVDLAILRGKKTVAEREATITALENSTDFAKDSAALLAGQTVAKIAGQDTQSGKQQAALSNEQAETQSQYAAAFTTELQACGQNPVQAHRNIMTLPKYSGLAAKLVPAS